MNLVFLGPPGVGKGTQAQLLAEKLGAPHISTGAMFRELIAEGLPLAKQAAEFVDRGEYVPDQITNELVAHRLAQRDTAGGFILDGYPRTEAQAHALDAALRRTGRQLDRVLEFAAAEEVLLQRIAQRLAVEGRQDDIPSVAKRRFETYRLQTEPLVDYYRKQGKLAEIDAIGSIPEVATRVGSALSPTPSSPEASSLRQSTIG